MSWSELERLVETAEHDGHLRRALRHCRSRSELVLAARRLQFEITLKDLHGARLLHSGQEDRAAAPSTGRSKAGEPFEA